MDGLDRETLATLLWLACKTKNRSVDPKPRWEHRPAPSAGGRHPVDLLVVGAPGPSEGVSVYNSIAHSLTMLDCRADHAEALISTARQLIPQSAGTVIWFAAQFDRTLSKYENGESLVWRDAGALLATLHLTAEALGLSFCALGHTGEPLVSEMLRDQVKASGVGGCVVGVHRPPAQSW